MALALQLFGSYFAGKCPRRHPSTIHPRGRRLQIILHASYDTERHGDVGSSCRCSIQWQSMRCWRDQPAELNYTNKSKAECATNCSDGASSYRCSELSGAGADERSYAVGAEDGRMGRDARAVCSKNVCGLNVFYNLIKLKLYILCYIRYITLSMPYHLSDA